MPDAPRLWTANDGAQYGWPPPSGWWEGTDGRWHPPSPKQQLAPVGRAAQTPNDSKWIENSPLHQRSQLRICHVRAIGRGDNTPATDGAPITQAFDFGRLGDQITAAGPLAPRVLAASERSELEITGPTSGSQIAAWQRFQVRTHANHLVDVRIIAAEWHSLANATDLLEDLYDERLTGEPSEWDDTYSIKPVPPVRPGPTQPFHQLVFVPNSQSKPNWETTQQLIYRANIDAIEEQSSIGQPEEINRRRDQLAAVGTYGSVLWGLQDFIERSIILSATLTVAALECIRSIRLETVNRYQHATQATAGISASRDRVDAIERLKAELTFGAEATSQINPLLQSLRVDAYHRTLQETADVLPQANLVARMLERIV